MDAQFILNLAALLVTTICLGSVATLIAGSLYLLIWLLNRDTHTLVVKNSSSAVAGVPFYIRKGRLIHETSYLEPLATLTLTKKKLVLDDKQKPSRVEIEYTNVTTVPLNGDNVASIAKINQALAEAQQATTTPEQIKGWDSARQQFDSLSPYTGTVPATLPVECNEIRASNYVDYAEVYYLNKLQPISGSSELNIELASDGTLSKASAKSEDKTFESVLGVLPLGKSVSLPQTSPPKAGAGLVEGPATEKFRYEFSLVAENLYVRHIYSADTDQTRTFQGPLPMDSKANWYRREVLASLKSDLEKSAARPEAKDKAKTD